MGRACQQQRDRWAEGDFTHDLVSRMMPMTSARNEVSVGSASRAMFSSIATLYVNIVTFTLPEVDR